MMNSSKLINCCIYVFLIASCSKVNPPIVIHPTQENLNSSLETSNRIDINTQTPKLNSNTLQQVFSSFETPTSTSTIGVDDGNQYEIFGRIEDVLIDSKNRVFILDYLEQEIRIFDDEGNYEATLGRKGKGPGELEFASSMALYKDSLLIVNNGYRVEFFQTSDDLIFLKTVPFEHVYENICISGNRLFAKKRISFENASQNKKMALIDAFTLPDMKPLFSFGNAYQSSNPMVVDRMSRGKIFCNSDSDTITFVYDLMPIVRGYSSTDGSYKWQTHFENLKYPVVTENNEGEKPKMTFSPHKGNVSEKIMSSIYFSPSLSLLQIEKFTRGDEQFDVSKSVFQVALDTNNGQAYLVRENPNRIIEASKKMIVLIGEDLTKLTLHKLDQ